MIALSFAPPLSTVISCIEGGFCLSSVGSEEIGSSAIAGTMVASVNTEKAMTTVFREFTTFPPLADKGLTFWVTRRPETARWQSTFRN